MIMKIMKGICLGILVLAFKASSSLAQYAPASQGDVDMIKNGKLSVVLKSVSEKELKKFKNAGDAEAFEKSIDDYNKDIQQVVKDNWHFTNDVSFISEEQAERLIAAREEEYCLLELGEYLCFDRMGGIRTAIPVLQIRSAAHPKSALVVCPIPKLKQNAAVLTYCLQQLINQLQDYEKGVGTEGAQNKIIETQTPLLKDKILLLCDKTMSGVDNLEAKGTLKKKYPYPYEIVSYEKLAEIILSKDERYAYVLSAHDFFTNQGSSTYRYFIIDAKDGHPLFLTKKMIITGFGMNGFNIGHLERAAKEVESK